MSKLFREYPDVVTIKQVQEMIQVGRNTVYKLLKSQQIKNTKTSKDGKYIILKRSVIEYLTTNNDMCYNEEVHCLNRLAS